MSKSNSGHFSGTTGAKLSSHSVRADYSDTNNKESDIIASRTHDLDLRAHPSKYKQLSRKQKQLLRKKMKDRTISKSEYKHYTSNKRLDSRRQTGVDNFWRQEKERLLIGKKPTRSWTPEQIHDILNDRKPKYNGKSFQGHHTYSVSQYPHLANQGSVIFPVTFKEHFYGWHGKDFKKSLPGKPINQAALR